MITLDTQKLDKLFKEYKDSFNLYIDQELYKWKAVKHFQDNWDIDAPDFTKMLTSALSLTKNLLGSNQFFPRKMILKFSENDENTVREMFRNLFDEGKEVFGRIEEFSKKSEEMLPRIENAENHFQNMNSITTYLWLRYPDKYYIFKYNTCKTACELLASTFTPSTGIDQETFQKSLELMQYLKEYISKDQEYIQDLKKALTPDCYEDSDFNTATIDFVFFMSAYYEGNYSGKRYWMYSPGEQASQWKDCIKDGAMYLGWDKLGRLDQYESRKAIQKKLQEQNNSTSSFKNDTLATWEFVHTIKPGDIVYVKQGRSTIIGKGIVTGDFYYDDKRSTYANARKVQWTHNGKWECKDKHARKTLTDITSYNTYLARLYELCNDENVTENISTSIQVNPDNDNNIHYWWLTANPKIWSAGTGWPVGEEQEYTLFNDRGNKRKIFQNFLDAKVGDKIICYESHPTKQIVGLAEISKANDGKTIGFIKKETLASPIDYAEFRNHPALESMEFIVNPNGSFFKVTAEEYAALMEMIEERNSKSVILTKTDNYTEADFLKEVFITKTDLITLESLIKTKKNIILQGAPGVGKTFSAKRLAYAIMGKKDDTRIKYVQFHQNYSYEDFVMGYKPTAAGFELKKGIFHEFCINAGNDPDHEYFFIIDEINRGNLSKIFGELLMLIENSYRGQKVALAYSGDLFTVPENLYIIGMMNTADRSLAMIDYALRRRFCFFKMNPEFDSEGFISRMQQIANPKFEKLVEKVKKLNEDICKDASLGEGFQIGHSYFCKDGEVDDQWLETLIKYDIIPTLEEYWFDNDEKVKEWSNKLLETLND